MTTPIYVYAAHRFSRGVAFDADPASDDVILYADTRAEAIERARTELSIPDPRPGGSARAYAHATARALLRQLGDGA